MVKISKDEPIGKTLSEEEKLEAKNFWKRDDFIALIAKIG
jgi:hypothetical protein